MTEPTDSEVTPQSGLLADLKWALRLSWSTERTLCSALSASALLSALLPAATALAMGMLVTEANVILRSTEPPEWRPAAIWLALNMLLLILTGVSASVRRYAEQRLRDLLNLELSTRILRHAATLDLEFFEDPDSQDTLSRASNQPGANFVQFLVAGLFAAGSGVLCASLLAVLIWVDWGAALVLLAAGVPFMLHRWRIAGRRFELERARSRQRRWASYFFGHLTGRSQVPETRILGLAPVLIQRFRERQLTYLNDLNQLYRTELAGRIAGVSAYVLGLGAVVAWVTSLALEGSIAIGALATFTVAAFRLRSGIADLATHVGTAREGSLFMLHLTEFLARRPRIVSAGRQQSGDEPPRVELRDVSFCYPGSTRPSVDRVSLDIEAGGVVALVGHNGSGKTTLAKLIAGLYEPTAGCILADDTPLAELDLEQWHRRTALVLESAPAYEATLHDNVALGDWDRLAGDRQAVEEIARRSGLDAIARQLPQGLDTHLGRTFGTADLSRGQWQSVAVARALAHDPGLLILDEPTSNLDVEAERQLYAAIDELASGRTTLLISHRFSTVMLAQTIFVLEEGRIVERGTHRELLAGDGLYSRLYRLHRSSSAGEGA